MKTIKNHKGKIVTVTGCGNGDGKTTIAFNLAGYFAKLGLKVLCIDEARNWNLFQMLTLQYGNVYKTGERIYIQESRAKDNAIYETIIPDVHVVHKKPFAFTLHQAKDIKYQKLVKRIFETYCEDYDIIIRDTGYVEKIGAYVDKGENGYSAYATFFMNVSVISNFTVIPYLSYNGIEGNNAILMAEFGTGNPNREEMYEAEMYEKEKVLIVPFGVMPIPYKSIYKCMLNTQKKLVEKEETKKLLGESLDQEDVVNKNYINASIEIYTDVILHDDKKAIDAERRTHIPTTLNGRKSVFSEDIDTLCHRVEDRVWSISKDEQKMRNKFLYRKLNKNAQ